MIDELGPVLVGRRVDAALLEPRPQLVRVPRPQLEALQRLDEGQPRPRRLQVDLVPLELDDGRAQHLARDVLEQLLDSHHRVVVVGIGLVPLEHRELGLVLVRDALVAEVLADLVDTLQAADDEPLEVELGRDPQVEIGVELVRVRDERMCEGAAVARLEDGRLDLDEAGVVQVAPDGRDDPRSRREVLPRLVAHQQVEVALPVAELGILEPVERVGQRSGGPWPAARARRRPARALRAASSSAGPRRRRCRRGRRRPRPPVRPGRRAGCGPSGRRGRGRRACPCRAWPSHGRRCATSGRRSRPIRAARRPRAQRRRRSGHESSSGGRSWRRV